MLHPSPRPCQPPEQEKLTYEKGYVGKNPGYKNINTSQSS